ncbi:MULTISPECIES: helix-turn-helix domain-containing protein [Anaerotruncus]|jgi:transcriptional regulator with XRE-family HTH domain|uniref:helix-turn-helix domain-containing protein n=1 Tax=Anaerotruncus TaxID=244127 RepID=UPI001313E7C2|nr:MULTISPECIES: helix-turn-helix transcriptional regulator [Anaerotruncus]
MYQRLKEMRLEHGLTEREVADALGCTIQTYQKYESGKKEIFSNTLLKLCNFYQVSADYLLDLTDSLSPYSK